MNTSNIISSWYDLSLISIEVHYWTHLILVVPQMFFGALGVVTNIINIVVFISQGVTSDSVSVSLFSRSIADFLANVLLLPRLMCFYLDTLSGVSYVSMSNYCTISSIIVTYPHLVFTKVACLITTYVSIERSLFVVFPLRVKMLIRTSRTVVINIVCYVVMVAAYTPYVANISFVWVTNTQINGTTTVLVVPSELGMTFNTMNYILNSLIVANVSLIIIAVTTVVLVIRLEASRKWRESVSVTGKSIDMTASAERKETMSRKNMELNKTITVITSIYLVCLMCSHLPAMGVLTVPGVSQNGVNRLLFDVMFTIRYDIDAVSSSINMFFYLRMSSKFRKTFNEVFRRK